MELLFSDYNNASSIINQQYNDEWLEVLNVLSDMPLHLKASDQAGKQGQAIFDPVGTNAYIKTKLEQNAWLPNKEIPEEYRFLGTDIDFVKTGVIIEVQFSNYPFLLNNLLRSELFYHAQTQFTHSPIQLLLIITKAHMFPASNSTLYYEQAQNQLAALSSNNVFDIPIRLVGLASSVANSVPCKWTSYDDPRYSRTVISQEDIYVSISNGRQKRSRTVITR